MFSLIHFIKQKWWPLHIFTGCGKLYGFFTSGFFFLSQIAICILSVWQFYPVIVIAAVICALLYSTVRYQIISLHSLHSYVSIIQSLLSPSLRGQDMLISTHFHTHTQSTGRPWQSHSDHHHSLSSILTGKPLEGIYVKNGWRCCSTHPVLGLLY